MVTKLISLEKDISRRSSFYCKWQELATEVVWTPAIDGRNPEQVQKTMELLNISEIGELPTVVITNGPVEAGFNGELISMILTFKNYNLNVSNLSFNYDGEKLTGVYGETSINFGSSIDLGTKASALGSLLENSVCSGEVRFVGPEELIANC